MKIDRAGLAAAAAPALLLVLFAVGAAAVLWGTMEPTERAVIGAVLEPRLALVLMVGVALAGAGGWLASQLWQRYGAGPGRLAEQVQALVAADVDRELDPAAAGPGAGAQLAQAVNALTRQRSALRRDIDSKVREASRDIEQERSRLAALMAELQQSVVVCNLDGRVLLYNQRARLQFRALAAASGLQGGSGGKGGGAGGNELIGIGRSIYAVFDRELVAHALESVRQRLARGAANPSAQFVTATRSGQLLRAQMAPVRAVAAAEGERPADATGVEPINGFVLMLDNITRDFADESQRDHLLHQLTEASRASLGNLQAAVELLDDPDLDAPTRERFQAVVRDEAAAMTRRIQELSEHTTRTLRTRWPLEEMRGADLVEAALRRIESAAGCRSAAQEVDPQLWLKVDSFSLLQALAGLAARLVDEYEIKRVDVRLARAGAHAGDRAHLDLVWTGQAMSTETVMGWETDPIRLNGESTPLAVRDVVERHGGAFWFERERVRHEAFFRFLLPLASDTSGEADEAAALGVKTDSRPEFYDFDLFKAAGGEALGALADRSLAELSYTVFDTETTGLNPSEGDEILQIGATRIVAGKLRRQECYEQLVDPQRPIPAAGIPIHGIQPEMVVGQPTIDRVLPAFHAFAADTVLVAHNAAFDMRFLQLKEASTGVRFEQPVLDTLLLSAVVAPQQESHSLEAIAQRLGVTVLGRHTAVGDAMVTAEVFLKLVPLLQERGIHTLGQAIEAAQQTYYARIRY